MNTRAEFGLLACLAGASLCLCGRTPAEVTGISHVHLLAKDTAPVKRLWIDVLGSNAVRLGMLDGVQIQDAYVWIEQGTPSGGTDGSVIRHLGVRVRELDRVLVRAARNGFHVRQSSRNSAELRAPDGVFIEVIGDPGMEAIARLDHLHLLVPDATLAKRWYSERFGPIPGIQLEFITAGSASGPTKGRAIDHVGFSGSKLEKPEFLTDPWGLQIELTEDRLKRSQLR
jgi:catechol 2,3-dioxygenase-like lactoylglutathione lyase family enzyme